MNAQLACLALGCVVARVIDVREATTFAVRLVIKSLGRVFVLVAFCIGVLSRILEKISSATEIYFDRKSKRQPSPADDAGSGTLSPPRTPFTDDFDDIADLLGDQYIKLDTADIDGPDDLPVPYMRKPRNRRNVLEDIFQDISTDDGPAHDSLLDLLGNETRELLLGEDLRGTHTLVRCESAPAWL